MRSGRAWFLLQRLLDRARPCRRGLLRPSTCAFLRIALRPLPCAPRGGAFLWWRKFHSRSPRLGKADCDRLLGRPRPMFSFANVFHFFAHKFPGLSGRRFPFPLIFAGPLDHIFFWHNSIAFAPRPAAGCRKSYLGPRPICLGSAFVPSAGEVVPTWRTFRDAPDETAVPARRKSSSR